MKNFEVHPIGWIRINEEGSYIEVDHKYISALQGLEGFGHIVVTWWFSNFDEPQYRNILEGPQPYKNAPDVMGMFATRSPIRPNPLGITTSRVIAMDSKTGKIQIDYTDAEDGTPVLDIKPYTPSFDRIESPSVPDWCANWPMSVEASGEFDWESIFNF